MVAHDGFTVDPVNDQKVNWTFVYEGEHVMTPMVKYTVQEKTAEALYAAGMQIAAVAVGSLNAGPIDTVYVFIGNVFKTDTTFEFWASIAVKLKPHIGTRDVNDNGY